MLNRIAYIRAIIGTRAVGVRDIQRLLGGGQNALMWEERVVLAGNRGPWQKDQNHRSCVLHGTRSLTSRTGIVRNEDVVRALVRNAYEDSGCCGAVLA